ncbi:guanylate cyclase alpha-like isoform X2 [Hylaeus volcanicus]|uniref:guanylate cyclase alpha-like isoform X2 n=1 Tax=Hylaeus volcanicus TaxID=313075 RepID=UPI0023B80FCF|nr:guanylate cyclase alpha-like isoform X2 [Hylaeus volcanicus]
MVPADVILLASSHLDGLVFIDTHLIDGGTHFKKKYAVKETQGDTKFSICSSIRGRLMCEAPKGRSETFKATLSLDGHPRVASLDYRCFVSQGSIICGCDWVLAVVVYTGHETRVSLQNVPFLPFYARPNSMEECALSKAALYVVFVCFLIWLVLLYLGFFYTPHKTSFTAFGGLETMLVEIILEHLKILVCVFPLFLSVLRYIASFLQTFTTLAGSKADEENFTHVYNSNTCSLLGQADFLITDKTGTLTNGQRMSFACLFIEGRVYGELALTKNGTSNQVKSSTGSFKEKPSKLVKKKTKAIKQKNLIFHLTYFLSSYFSNKYNKQKSKIWKFIHLTCKKNKKNKIQHFKKKLIHNQNNSISYKHQMFPLRSPAASVRMLYPKFSSKPLVNKRCFSCPSIIISHTTRINKSKKRTRSFQCKLSVLFFSTFTSVLIFAAFPSYLASRTEFSDTRILDDLCKKNVRSTSIQNMLLGMSLCNSVATTSDALMYLLKSSMNNEHHTVEQRDSLCNFPFSQTHSSIEIPLDESIWTSSRHPQLTDEILWSSSILWKEEAASFLRYHAEYPEEECLLAGCTSIGFRLLWRSPSLIILERRGKILKYEVLGYNAFDSSRQRMSIVVRLENTENVYLFCKGSDNAVLPLCSRLSQCDNHKKIDRIRRYIRYFSQNVCFLVLIESIIFH